MANSSEWLGAVAESSTQLPDWMEAVPGNRGFNARLPFAGLTPPEVEPEQVIASQPIPEPLLDPQATQVERAFAQGEAQGRAVAKAECAQEFERQRALRLVFRQLDQAAMDTLASELATTVEALCAQALGGIEFSRDTLVAQCEAAAQKLGSAASDCRLQLHPEDLAMLDEESCSAWNSEANPTLERGTIVLIGPEGEVSDGPEEWRRAIAAALRG